MHLKRLTLKGFKSFAEPVSIGLEPGVNVVVGPNGSGKSNFVDAVAWVLGAQAPSAVRSARMDDVIFAGTANKPALGRAEVSLTIDNSESELPVAFPEVRITRTLFRDGESSYALNGVTCRLLDIAELLSDRGVGRQQHVIVSQNQIEAVLNSRPGDRRAVVEEAAGVLKYRRRRERAERRLLASDADLVRVRDLRRELRRQLRPLEKQAAAASRHAGLLSELESLRVYLAGREIFDLRHQLREHAEEAESRTAAGDQAKAELHRLHEMTAACERRLIRDGGHHSTELLVRWEGLRQRALGLKATVAERRIRLEEQANLLADRSLMDALTAEAEHSRRELAEISAESDAAKARGVELADEEAQLESDIARLEAELGDIGAGGELEVPAAVTATANARGELAALSRAISSDQRERARLLGRLTAARQSAEVSAATSARCVQELGRCENEATRLSSALAAAESVRQSAAARLATISASVADSEAERRHWKARHEALSLALNQSTPVDEILENTPGVVGVLADLVTVTPGLEAAFAAAVGEPAGIVVANSPRSAETVLHRLESADVRAAVIALAAPLVLTRPEVPSSLTALRPLVAASGHRIASRRAVASGTVQETVRHIESFLDCLLGHTVIVQDDWRAAVRLAAQHPNLEVVTVGGDRLSSRGWYLGRHTAAGVTAAWREAAERAESAAVALTEAVAEQRRHRTRLARHAASVADLRARLAKAEQAVSAAASALNRSDSDLRRQTGASQQVLDRLAVLEQRLEDAVANHERATASLPDLEAAESVARELHRRRAAARTELDRRRLGLRTRRAELSVANAGLTRRRRDGTARLAQIESRLARHAAARASAATRQSLLQRRISVLAALTQEIAARISDISAGLAAERDRSRRWSERAQHLAARIDELRRRSVLADTRLQELRKTGAAADIAQAELRTKLQVAVERLRAEHKIAPAAAVETRCPDLPEDTDPGERARHLASELQIMGPVNPLALAEYQELKDRDDLVSEQLDDIRAARRALNKVIRSINRQMEAVFARAFTDVAANFGVLFEALFPGGEGKLTLTDPDNLLTTGLDVEARPSGKRVKRLSLLSGGERTLAALAFLFAVFRSRPSPFYVLDEVEASLDDVNLQRFLVLVDEFRADAQLVIVTHQKRTMEAADFLYGVSMKPGGSSMVVSERLSDAA